MREIIFPRYAFASLKSFTVFTVLTLFALFALTLAFPASSALAAAGGAIDFGALDTEEDMGTAVGGASAGSSQRGGDIEWEVSLGGVGYDSAYSVSPTKDGGCIVVGRSDSDEYDISGNHGGADFLVVKMSGNGDVEWLKCLGGSKDDDANSVQQTSDGGYIVAGWTSSNDGDVSGNHGHGNFWIVRLNAKGNIIWQRCLGGSGFDTGMSIQQTSDGGLIVTGTITSNNGDVSGNHGGIDAWVARLNAKGEIIWQRCLGGAEKDNALFVQQTRDGGHIVVGRTKSNDGDVSGNHGGVDAWVVKLDKRGAIEWQKCLGGLEDDSAEAVQQTPDGGYIVAGDTKSNDGDVSGNHGGRDAWVVKLSAGGAIEWRKCLGGSANDYAKSVHVTADGGYVIAGGSGSVDGDVSGGHGHWDIWVVNMNKNGLIRWQQCLGGSGAEVGNFVRQVSDGSYIVVGNTESGDGDVSINRGGKDMWIVKLRKEM
ncbi:MAG: hypothetical protein LBQ19_02980 [Synergistaceae bacterium]|jgi:hypothetical protein|nr:hypothetical protein [Synergistaceae bacterium]